ncbi:MAG: hypothetical protein ACLRL6_07340 [Clostridium sp.]
MAVTSLPVTDICESSPFKLLRREYVGEALQTEDISAFRKILLQDDTWTVWLPYTELERSLITWQDRLYSLMITYGNRVLTYIGMGVFILLTGVPCFLLFMMFLDLLYAVLLYTGLFISLLFLFTRFRHHPYFFRHEQLLLTDIRESTLPNPPIQKPDISKL